MLAICVLNPLKSITLYISMAPLHSSYSHYVNAVLFLVLVLSHQIKSNFIWYAQKLLHVMKLSTYCRFHGEVGIHVFVQLTKLQNDIIIMVVYVTLSL